MHHCMLWVTFSTATLGPRTGLPQLPDRAPAFFACSCCLWSIVEAFSGCSTSATMAPKNASLGWRDRSFALPLVLSLPFCSGRTCSSVRISDSWSRSVDERSTRLQRRGDLLAILCVDYEECQAHLQYCGFLTPCT